MLSFFGHPYIAPAACYEPEPEPSLDALLRLFSGLDNARAPFHPAQRPQPRRPQRPQACAPRHMNVRPRPVSTFTPRFDVRETANAYVLHGDLAGLQRDNVRVDFVDPQTLVIRGRVERVYENQPQQQTEEGTVNTTAPETTPTEISAPEPTTTEPAAVLEQNKPEEEVEIDWEEVESTTSSTHSKYHRPTVEDDADDDNDTHSHVSTPKSVTSETAKPATKETETAPAPETKEVQKAAAPQAPAPAPAKAASERVWLSERSVGEFSRAFTFAERVDQDRVTATLDNGVLSVVVPKAPRHVVRRVLIF
ncbi:HSP20-like chaperone [Schizothecium vesticola]|uniref:HSP20-like chaperone n=1 Tax=Schizothecium vesticola TaxID=314040 RepID=A0AA40EPA8_9PEZI|nr:HSP20-like chaperone [Schizothecium vesticola]